MAPQHFVVDAESLLPSGGQTKADVKKQLIGGIGGSLLLDCHYVGLDISGNSLSRYLKSQRCAS